MNTTLETKIEEVESKIAYLVTQIELTRTELLNSNVDDFDELTERLEDEEELLLELEDILTRLSSIK